MQKPPKKETSWEPASDWYDQIVGDKGHTYHTDLIFPNLLPMMQLKAKDTLLDIGCGQGVLSRVLPKGVHYTGLDLSKSLIVEAKKRSKDQAQEFIVQNACIPFDLGKQFSHIAMILCFQNMEESSVVLSNVAKHLSPKGKAFFVLNHPCFRIPRQTSWGVDEPKKIQYRRIDRYMSPLQIPIMIHPSQKEDSPSLISFHTSLSDLTCLLFQHGFLIEKIEEWCSNKESVGRAAKMENRARKEFPLFMTIQACLRS